MTARPFTKREFRQFCVPSFCNTVIANVYIPRTIEGSVGNAEPAFYLPRTINQLS